MGVNLMKNLVKSANTSEINSIFNRNLLLVSLLSLTMIGCGGGSSGGGSSDPDPDPIVEPEPTVNQEATLTLAGDFTVGETLTATVSDANGVSQSGVKYTWLADEVKISGATSASYTLTTAEGSKVIKVQASFDDNDGYSESPIAIGTTTVRQQNFEASGLTIDGVLVVGETLSLDGLEDANGLPDTFSYQWMADEVNIIGATAQTYVLTTAELGKVISVSVQFTDQDNYSEAITSAKTTLVKQKNFEPTSPTVVGDLIEGESISVAFSDANGYTASEVVYQWSADNTLIDGANSNSLDLTGRANQALTVSFSYTDHDGYSTSVSSSAIGTVRPLDQTGVITIPVTQVLTKGETLNADTFVIEDNNGQGDRNYTWSSELNRDTSVDDAWLYTPENNEAIALTIEHTDGSNYQQTFNLDLLQNRWTSKASLLAEQADNEARWSDVAVATVKGYQQFMETMPSQNWTSGDQLAEFALSRYPTTLNKAWAVVSTSACQSGTVTLTNNLKTFSQCVLDDGSIINGSLEVLRTDSPITVKWTTSALEVVSGGAIYHIKGQETTSLQTDSVTELTILADQAIELSQTMGTQTVQTWKAAGAQSNYLSDGAQWQFSQHYTQHTWLREGDQATFKKQVVQFDTPLSGAQSATENLPAEAGEWSLELNGQSVGFSVEAYNDVFAEADLNQDGVRGDAVADSTDTESLSIKWNTSIE